MTALEISCEQADKNKQHLGAFLIPQTYATVACQIAWDQFECTAGERPSFQIGGHPVYFLLRLHLAARDTPRKICNSVGFVRQFDIIVRERRKMREGLTERGRKRETQMMGVEIMKGCRVGGGLKCIATNHVKDYSRPCQM